MSQLNKDVMVALDFSSKKEVMDFLDLFTEEKPFVKIGMELYYAEGPAIVREIKARGHKIFLDLKLHDIPNTVKKAMSVLSNLDVDMCNLHAAGTVAMMEGAACEAIDPVMPEGHTSVGMELNVKHLSATPVGLEVRADATVTAVDGKVITFELAAYDEAGLIGKGTHKRCIVNSQKFLDKTYSKL